jgi:hypothetical protein
MLMYNRLGESDARAAAVFAAGLKLLGSSTIGRSIRRNAILAVGGSPVTVETLYPDVSNHLPAGRDFYT